MDSYRKHVISNLESLHLINGAELYDPIRHLNLSKNQVQLLGSRLQAQIL
jgi:hypothetical protein